MLRARLFWRWCRVHPRISGIGAAVLVLFVVVGATGDSDPKQRPDAAGSSTPVRHTVPAAPARSSASASASALSSSTSAARSSAPARISAVAADAAQRGDTTALVLLATLPVKGRAPQTGYTRDAFGSAWTDDNGSPMGHNGCDTRNDVLRRDLTAVVLKPNSNGCAVLTGVLHDPYTDTTISFTRGETSSTAVQIDHVVSLSDAWQTGAGRWTEQTRTDLANDPLNLLAVDGPTNEAKGDGDTATWLPPNHAYRCAYVARQVAVKARYHLWTTPAEHAAIARVLTTCSTQMAPTETQAAVVQLAPTRTATPTPAPHTTVYTPPPSDVYYQNCTAVRAAGKAPLLRGQPGYSSKLDRDGDGKACE